MVARKPTEEILESVREAYERGQTLEALRRAEAFAPLKDWSGVEGSILAARIAVNTGAPRLESRLSVRAWRTNPTHGAAQAQYGYEFIEQRGPVEFLLAVAHWPEPSEGTPLDRAELLALQGRAMTDLRDFSAADDLIKRAESCAMKPWIHLQRSHLLERQDRIEAALDVARAARTLHVHPFHRPSVQMEAYLLQLLDRDEDAITLLRQADAVLQSGPAAAQLFALLSDNGRWAEAHAALERYVELSPLMELPFRKWVSSQRARAAYHLGKRTEAAAFAMTLEDDFHQAFAKRLAAIPEEPERVQLDVTFVRQHFKTCAPATLAAIGRFWKMPGEHIKLAEAMCYDGTPAWQQREWAEQNGWFVREFCVTHDSAIALILRGIPFAVSTVEAASAHMMAIIGFDRARGTILLRDPGRPYVLELAAKEFFERYRTFGPRGMVFLPVPQREKLDGLALPDADIYDGHHEVSRNLANHQREIAVEALRRMEQLFGDHELVWQTRLELAGYDANHSERVRCLDKLLELLPSHPARQLQRFGCMRNAAREERIAFLQKACSAENADPYLFLEMARALAGDARCLPRARVWLKRAGRYLRLDSGVVTELANQRWDQGLRQEATELYRHAANLENFREQLFQSWFIACRQTRQTEKALAHLQDRFAQFGSRSEQPALTLAWAWREMEQPVRAREVLLEAIQLRPNDGYLRLRAATLLNELEQREESDRLLESAKGKARDNDWLRSAAQIAEYRLDFALALRNARQLLESEPLAMDAHSGVARALGRIEGSEAAIRHLREACARFPHHYSLQRMLVDWSSEIGPSETEIAAQDLLKIDPTDAWADRELALALSRLNRGEEAISHALEAANIEPQNSYCFSVLGHVFGALNRNEEAAGHLRRAIELSVDNSNAITTLLDLASSDTERKRELAFVQRQLVTQVVAGDGLLAFMDVARPILEPEELLRELRQAHQERPDLWHAWSALASQCGRTGKLDDALDLARKAAERFSHLPRVWLDLSTIHRWRKEAEAEVIAAQRAFEINPGWSRSALALSDALERQGKFAEALRIYDRALTHLPKDAQLHACRASLLWRRREVDAALRSVEQALRLAPGYDWAWSLLEDWSSELGQEGRAIKLARELTRERPGETAVWLTLAGLLKGTETLAERLDAVEQALRLNRQLTEAWDRKVELLTVAECFDKAIAACNEGAAVCNRDIFMLRGRLAWIEARRRKMPEAIELMRAVLKENSSYVWGWHQMAGWLADQENFKEALAAMEQILPFRPHDPWLHKQIGYYRLQLDDKDGAKRAFNSVLQFVPTDSYAAERLFNLHMEANDLREAAATLELMRAHQPGARMRACEIMLSIRRQDFTAAKRMLEKLCESPDPDPWPIDAAARACREKISSGKTLRILEAALKKPSCNPEVGATMIRMLSELRDDFLALRVFFRLKSQEAQLRAADPLVSALAEHSRPWLFRFLLWRRREVIRQNPLGWGRAGYALMHFKRYRAVVEWQSDWRTRPDLQPWMLFNQCLALRQLGQYAEAHDVALHVTNAWGHREGAQDLRLFLAVEDALVGDLKNAREHLRSVTARENVTYDRQILALAKALVEHQESPLSERVSEFRKIWQRLSSEFTETRLLNCMRDVRRTFRRAGEVFVRNGAGWRAKWWFTWRLNWQWSLIPLVPLAIAMLIPISMHIPVVLLAVAVGIIRSRKK